MPPISLIPNMSSKPFSQACENNKQAILDILGSVFASCKKVLEVGSGTGQHATYFAANMPWLEWQPTDQQEYLAGVEAWRTESNLSNFLPCELLDVRQHGLPQPVTSFDAVFTANTLHIMHWPSVESLFGLLSELETATQLCIYGPFNYAGEFTSPSNARFNQWLQDRDPASGIRDIEAIIQLARAAHYKLYEDYAMPANNRLLHFQKTAY